MKVHGLIDADTQAFLSWEFTKASVADTVMLEQLLSRIPAPVGDVYADAGYLSAKNAHAITAKGGTPFLRPRTNTRGRPAPREKDAPSQRTSEPFRAMIDEYQRDKTAWLSRYSRRNSVESAWSGVKRRFTGAVMAMTDRVRRTEAALKLLAWNITRVIRLPRRI